MISRSVNLRIMDSSPSAESRAIVTVREVNTIEEYDACIDLQRAAFGLPDLEISPRRHLIVSRMAGGWTLGAFAENKLIGFVHHLAAVKGSGFFCYSHMMAVDPARSEE